MTDTPKISKVQLLKIIDDIEKNPNDKFRILGDAGISLVGVGLGAAAAGSLAAAAGATSIAGLTTAASWVGLSVVAATPVGWIVGSALAGGTVAYGISRLVRGGSLAEGRKAELLQGYREAAKDFAAIEAAGEVSNHDRSAFILSLRELIDKNAIPPANAFRLIEQVEQGRIQLSQAFILMQGLLIEVQESSSDTAATGSSLSPDKADTNDKKNHEPAPVSSIKSIQQSISAGGDSFFTGMKSFGSSIASVGASIQSNSNALIDSVSASTGSAAESVKRRFSSMLQKESRPPESIERVDESAQVDSDQLENLALRAAPVIWMLGKTGAGKTSVISTLTGSPLAEVGNGYVSCTRTSQLFDFPQESPLIQFLDTRGLGEAGYDPSEDLAWQQERSNLVMVVMKVSDPAQDVIINVVKSLRKKHKDWPLLVAQTGLHEFYSSRTADHPGVYPYQGVAEDDQNPDIPKELRNALAHQRELFKGLKGDAPVFVPIDFTLPSDGFNTVDFGKQALTEGILRVAPEALRRLVKMQLEQSHAETGVDRFNAMNTQILYWSAGASAVGAAPVVGMVTVPAAQLAMLTHLAKAFGVDWTVKDISALASMLGVAIMASQGGQLALRQLAKLGPWMIPVAAAQDYAVTYGLGRAACVYLQARQDNTDANAEQIKHAFQDGLKRAFSAANRG